jgi:hypothetical protein
MCNRIWGQATGIREERRPETSILIIKGTVSRKKVVELMALNHRFSPNKKNRTGTGSFLTDHFQRVLAYFRLDQIYDLKD